MNGAHPHSTAEQPPTTTFPRRELLTTHSPAMMAPHRTGQQPLRSNRYLVSLSLSFSLSLWMSMSAADPDEYVQGTSKLPTDEGAYGVTSFFVAADGAIMPQETFSTKWTLVGLQVPDFVMVTVPNSSDSVSVSHQSAAIPKVLRQKLRDFQGIDNVDEDTRRNLMNFSYHLTVGDLDEAYRSVQTIKSCLVWENMARMCVKTRRLDVAQICISNLSSSRGSSARIASSLFFSRDGVGDGAKEEGSGDADGENPELMRLAMIAIDLKMYKEAELLLKESGRFDVVVKMYQALGQWKSAVQVAEQHDRVNLSAAYYQYADYLQESGNIEAAIPLYEQSESPLQIAQMLHQHQRLSLLQNYAEVECFVMFAAAVKQAHSQHTAC